MIAAPVTEPPRPRGGRPRDPSRDGVIRAAILRLLSEVGYGALTMDAVASEAGVGKATIYRRWRTKQELVVDTLAELDQVVAVPPDTGTVAGDVRQLMSSVARAVESPAGSALRSLLPVMRHQPELMAAFENGPLRSWRTAYDEVWARAEARGEVRPELSGSITAEATSALLVQRWLLTGRPVDEAYVDEVFDTVVRPLLDVARP
ncbi:TetR/AcrR family transcriptional regulator [Geodermatophilus marinus]|uniref:TetR/AcrR family transcriptional regulator n=1 Tax=Geodermatophilus sp. LHW52908 TaxID=2303986 RepID=UPI000E3CCAE8|nr:TetR/AcrR family transcriptional regulator [Geodermatophilus sp. LHW52908]RFU20280.1 TetR/AcrR family transcriptional regulator [Geodermatophilus sp. LHW52908]